MTDLIPASSAQSNASGSLTKLTTVSGNATHERKFHPSTIASVATGVMVPNKETDDGHFRELIEHITGSDSPYNAPAAATFLKRTIPWVRDLKVAPQGLLESDARVEERMKQLVAQLERDHGDFVPVGTLRDNPAPVLPAVGEQSQTMRLADKARAAADRLLPRR